MINIPENLFSFSFVIPVYNAGSNLEVCLESIKNQDYEGNKIEIIVADGGSSDNSIEIAKRHNCQMLHNTKRLAEYGVQLGVQQARGDFVVIFAADNELVGEKWLSEVNGIFNKFPDLCAAWGRLVSGECDPPLNKYFELIQSDPLNWFLNNNLQFYKKRSSIYENNCFIFEVSPQKPLVWGANGLVYRADKIRDIWAQEGYLGDNDAFQYMIEKHIVKVAYFDRPFVYHHHVAKLSDWVKKWKRNFRNHLLDKQKTRNMNWVFTSSFKFKLIMWIIYSLVPVFSVVHAVYLSIKDKSIFWLYHPLCCIVQTAVYVYLVVISRKVKLDLAPKYQH